MSNCFYKPSVLNRKIVISANSAWYDGLYTMPHGGRYTIPATAPRASDRNHTAQVRRFEQVVLMLLEKIYHGINLSG